MRGDVKAQFGKYFSTGRGLLGKMMMGWNFDLINGTLEARTDCAGAHCVLSRMAIGHTALSCRVTSLFSGGVPPGLTAGHHCSVGAAPPAPPDAVIVRWVLRTRLSGGRALFLGRSAAIFRIYLAPRFWPFFGSSRLVNKPKKYGVAMSVPYHGERRAPGFRACSAAP